MLGDKLAMATAAVRDIEAAARFYEGVLGLTRVDAQEGGVVVYAAGPARLLVYQSTFAGTNQATAVTWDAGAEVDALTRDLAGKGVRFERYEFPGAVHEGDVHVMGELRAAWFKDPDGNIHSLVGRRG
jgi:catechol 2,3-dioxygenase-like lactoylglutathione lyase family enzyme